jgi:hypothetical protein
MRIIRLRFKTYKGQLRFLCLMAIILIIGSIVADVITVKKIYITKKLSTLTHFENGTIYKLSSSSGSLFTTVCFYLENEEKLYKMSDIFRNLFKGKPGDSVRVIFNKTRSQCIFIDHLKATYAVYFTYFTYSTLAMIFGMLIFLKIVYPERKKMLE